MFLQLIVLISWLMLESLAPFYWCKYNLFLFFIHGDIITVLFNMKICQNDVV